MKLTGAMINAENSKTLGDFYTKIFGEPGWHQDDWYGWQVGSGQLMIGPHSEVHGMSKEPYRVMVTFESEDVRTEYNNIVNAGAKIIAEPYQPDPENSPTIWLATLADPEGNYIQVASPWKE